MIEEQRQRRRQRKRNRKGWEERKVLFEKRKNVIIYMKFKITSLVPS